MKKIIAVLLSVLLVLSVGMLFVSADVSDDDVIVSVSIFDKEGKIAVAVEPVAVIDIDGDNALTINDALYAAHEQFYEGGAAAGYATEMTKWGLSLMKLWGEANGGSYGYLVNNTFAWSLTDPVSRGDYVAAFVYTDTEEYSDQYSYFEYESMEVIHTSTGDFTLMKKFYDEDGNEVSLPVEGAELTVDGEPTGVFTDADGNASYTFTTKGDYLVSAVAEDQLIIPPVCMVRVHTSGETPDQSIDTDVPTDGAGDDTTVHATKDEATKDSPSNIDTADNGSSNGGTSNGGATDDTATKDGAAKVDSSSASAAAGTTPKTSDVTNLILWIVIAAVCFAGIVGAVVFYKKRYGKK